MRINTSVEADYYRYGGILQYVLRRMIQAGASATPFRTTLFATPLRVER